MPIRLLLDPRPNAEPAAAGGMNGVVSTMVIGVVVGGIGVVLVRKVVVCRGAGGEVEAFADVVGSVEVEPQGWLSGGQKELASQLGVATATNAAREPQCPRMAVNCQRLPAPLHQICCVSAVALAAVIHLASPTLG